MGKNQLKIGSLLTYLNIGISFIIPLFYTPIMLRILGQNEYGVYSIANSVISYLTLLNLGMGMAIIRYVSKYRAENNKDMVNKMVSLFILIYGILSILVLIAGSICAIFCKDWFGKGLTISELETLQKLIFIMTFSTALSFIGSVFSTTAGAYERFIFRKILDIIATIAAPVLNLIVLYAGYKSVGIAMNAVYMQLIYIMVYFYYIHKNLKINITFKNLPFFMLKDVFSFSIFVFISSLVDMLYWATDKVLLGALAGSAAVAVYNVGGTFTSMLQNLSAAISNVFGARINMFAAKNTSDEVYSELLIRIGRIQYYVVSLVMTGYIAFGKTFIHFWAGDEYSLAYYVALLTMGPLVIPLIQNIAFTTLMAKNKHQFRAIIYFIIAIINIIGTYLSIPKYGLIGAAVCTCVAFIVGNGIIMNIYYAKVLKFRIIDFWKNIFSISIVPLALCSITVLLHFIYPISNIWRFLIEIVIYTIIFVLLSYSTEFNDYEKNLFLEPIKLIYNKIYK